MTRDNDKKNKGNIRDAGLQAVKASGGSFGGFEDLTLDESQNTPKPAEKAASLPVQYQKPATQGKNLKSYTPPPEDSESDIRKKGRMGDQLVELGLITEAQLNVAL